MSKMLSDSIMRKKTVEKLPPLDGGWGWACVLSCCCCLVLFGSIGKSFGIFYVAFEDRFRKSATATSWVIALTMFLFAGLAPIVSILCNKFSCRTITCVGGILMSLGLLGTAFAPTLLVVYFTFGVVLAVGMSCVYTSSFLIISDYFDKKKGVANGIATAGTGLGALIFPPVIQQLLDFYGFQGMLLIMSALVLNICATGSLYRPLNTRYYRPQPGVKVKAPLQEDLVGVDESLPVTNGNRPEDELTNRLEGQPRETMLNHSNPALSNGGIHSHETEADKRNGETRTSDDESEEDNDAKTEMLNQNAELSNSCGSIEKIKDASTKKKQPKCIDLSLLKDVAFSFLLLMMLCASGVITINMTFINALAEDNGIGLQKSAFLLSILGLGECLSRPVFGLVFDIVSLRKYRIYIYCSVVLLVGLCNVLLGLLAHNFSCLLIGCLIRGIGGGTLFAQRTTILTDMIGQKQVATGFGFLMLAFAFGGVVAQNIGGVVKDYTGQYNLTFIISGIISMMATSVFTMYIYWEQFHKIKDHSTGAKLQVILETEVA